MITIEEAKKAMDEMMAQGTSEDEMLGILYLMFQDDEISFDELEALVDALGYEITEEFRNMSPEQQKTDGFKINEDAEGVSDEQIEDAKETEEDEVQGNNGSDEDGGNGQGEDQNADNGGEKQPESETNSKEDKEAEERAKARKLYGFKD